MNNLEIGIVIEVNGFINKIAAFDNTNHSNFIKDGKLIKNVNVNSFVLITQGFVKIVARINSESIWDMQNNNLSLDNRFRKKSIKRVLEVQTIGYIKNNKFYSGSSFLPMIGNVSSIPTDEEINLIYINSYIESGDYPSILIGKSLIERNTIKLPINAFFASHIGVFGNTGSGKSNTLHKLFYELFKTDGLSKIKENSKFLVLDFNDEYTQRNSFGKTKDEGKKIYRLSTQNGQRNTYPILKKTFFSSEMLSILFQAKPQTQAPFLHRVVVGIDKYHMGMESLSNWIAHLIKSIFTGIPNQNVRDRLMSSLKASFEDIDEHLQAIEQTEIYTRDGSYCFKSATAFFDGDWCPAYSQALGVERIKQFIIDETLSPFEEFELRCNLQLVSDLMYGNVISEYINPLLSRISSKLESIKKYIKIVDELDDNYFLQVISLKKLNQEAKKVISLLISKMYFDIHKSTNRSNRKSFHLIIDEAHNILSSQSSREHENWKDYRLELFEEIIKEGRKFSFFLTISSQRPADISPTILSQVHNFFLHKLVNERDLQIIDNSISTLDKITKSMLPILSQGVCIVSGDALTMPITVNVDFIKDITLRPKSDTIQLTDIWK